MDETPERLAGKPSWLISQLSVHVHRLVADAFAAEGARGYHYRILAALDEFGATSQIRLAQRSNMDRSDVVAAINELAAHGFVERSPDPDDRRRNLVSLTGAGAHRLEELEKVIERVQEDLLAPLPHDERAVLSRLMGRLLDHHKAR